MRDVFGIKIDGKMCLCGTEADRDLLAAGQDILLHENAGDRTAAEIGAIIEAGKRYHLVRFVSDLPAHQERAQKS